jgi:hypothetical protein
VTARSPRPRFPCHPAEKEGINPPRPRMLFLVKNLPQNPPRGLHQSHIPRRLLACPRGGASLGAHTFPVKNPSRDLLLQSRSTYRRHPLHHQAAGRSPAQTAYRSAESTFPDAWWRPPVRGPPPPSRQRPSAATCPPALTASTVRRLHAAAASLTPPDRPNG